MNIEAGHARLTVIRLRLRDFQGRNEGLIQEILMLLKVKRTAELIVCDCFEYGMGRDRIRT